MFLRPQHFQYLDQYFTTQAMRQQCSLAHHYWGFTQLRLDEDALAFGHIQIQQAAGVLPDGTVFSMDAQQAPKALVVPDNTYAQQVFLALPKLRAQDVEVCFEEQAHSAARYQVVETEVLDRCDPHNEPALVQQGRLRWQLLLEDQVDGDWVVLPIAVIKEKNTQTAVHLDESFIVPCLHHTVSTRLNAYIKEVYSLVSARSELLAQRLQHLSQLHAGDMSELLALHSLNTYKNRLWGVLQLPHHHPEALYLLLLELLGGLSTFHQPSKQPLACPTYVHQDLRQSFEPLMQSLRVALNQMLDQMAIRIELVDKGHGMRVGQVTDTHLWQSARFVIAVRADLPEEQVRQHFPAQAKLGPVDRIRDLVHLQLPGVILRSLSHVPRELPVHAGYVYFALEQQGEMWQQLQHKGALALHLAGEFPGLDLTCWAIRVPTV